MIVIILFVVVAAPIGTALKDGVKSAITTITSKLSAGLSATPAY